MNFEIREYNLSDLQSLQDLWVSVFGDNEELVRNILIILPSIGTCFVCSYQNKVISMSFVFRGLKYNGKELAYIYAVATSPNFRKMGLAEKVVNECINYANKNGIHCISIAPASEHLFEWYERIIGTKYKILCSKTEIPFSNSFEYINIESINTSAYLDKRNLFLAKNDTVIFPLPYFEIENQICLTYGGGLYSFSDGIAACYTDGQTLHIKELICSKETRNSAIMTLMSMHNSSSAIITEKGNATPYIAYYGLDFAETPYWGPILD